MNEGPIFLVGIIIFAITIYGTVMAGGLALSRVVADQQPPLRPAPEDGPPVSTDPVEERHP